MFFAITGAIYLGGARSVIIRGLYWKKGTVSAAWTSMLVGSALAASGSYVLVSLLTCKTIAISVLGWKMLWVLAGVTHGALESF